MNLRILIFDDNANMRHSQEKLFSYMEDMECVGACEDCRNVLQIVEERRPDVVLMDIDMP